MIGIQDKTLESWAWEFLRRREDYRDAYKQCIADERFLSPAIFSYEPPRHRDESEAKWRMRAVNETGTYCMMTYRMTCARNWLLRDMVDPVLSYGPRIQFIRGTGAKLFERYDEVSDWVEIQEDDEANGEIDPDQALVSFDLTRPVKPQMKIICKLLIERQKATSKLRLTADRSANWKNYLIALDAFEMNPKITMAELGRLVGGLKNKGANYSDTGRKTLHAAQKIQKNYTDIIRGHVATV